jgi:hypothetical protein
MYNMYPIFESLSSNRQVRDRLLNQCYDTVRLLEQGYHWMVPVTNKDEKEDALGIALNGSEMLGVEVPSVNDWYNNRDSWTFSLEESEITGEAIIIKGEMSEDLQIFYSVDDMILLFDYNENEYTHVCDLVLDYLKAEGAAEKVESEAKISALRTYNYITEEARPRDVLYYLCKLDDRRSEENR